jgi:hypothetical protein
MLLYKWWFESQLAMHHDAPTFTLSPQSVAIKGMQLAHLSDLQCLPPIRREIEERIQAERTSAAQEVAVRNNEPVLRHALKELIGGLDELEALSARALKANEDLGLALSDPKAAAPLLAELNDIDGRILAVSERGIAGFLMQSLIHSIGSRGEGTVSQGEPLSDGASLYRGIMESARWQRSIIHRALSELEVFPKGSGPSADLLK